MTGPVKFQEINALRMPQQELSLVDRQRHIDADQRGFDMSGGVLRRIMLMLEVDARGD